MDEKPGPVTVEYGPTDTTSDIQPTQSNEPGIDVVVVSHKRPYGDVNFIGTYVAAGLGACSVYGAFVLPATSLSYINTAIGPSANITGVVLAWTLCLAVGYTLVGRLSDIFGRRWFFIGASLLATLGTIIGATAHDVNQLIGANVLLGLGAAVQLSFNYILPELVPMKDRFYVVSLIFIFALPLSGFGPVIGRLLIVHTTAGWRWFYYINIILNGLSSLLYFLFYFPPAFGKLHRNRSLWQEIKDLDFGGIILYSGGFLVLCMGLSWGGVVYPWGSAHVIATLVAGAVTVVIFVLYEIYMPLNRPLVPMHLFKSRDYCVLTVISAVGGMLYYSLNVIYPTMIAALFTTDPVRGGLLACAIGGGVAAGQFSSSLWAKPGGQFRWKLFFSVVACTAFTAAMAGVKYNEHAASALMVLASFFIGALESLVGIAITFCIKDQSEIGVAVGVYGSVRSAAGCLATSLFATILMNRVTHNIEHTVVPALVEAGLPVASVKPFLTALESGNKSAIAQVPGVTTSVIGVAVETTKWSYSNAFSLVFLVTLAFGICSCIVAFFSAEVEKYYTDDVVRQLDRGFFGKHRAASEDTDKI
ncbi:hypothetical protein M409DRAFT_23970 [Zasmidium cellare ATCC 36951]|uniref:Major facilitator superfamily (MFS) profile domain-containing protein n=1 Tax=Zasmidium cellare ATCC 36951 TaxID=1080233 RepID=A0A6A6CHM7_ZASCE|nr:uncharacterized protein M409DRAFT_23970 [Zasmidium cellare ATCC 36951]KAF2165680.1 hypothetical protein M409DRAFT_23970 [Zasmidium cellare ATCC 36951]